MHRTKHRPLATGAVSARGAVIFAALLSAVSVAWLAITVNSASAWLTAAAIGFYVVVYTLLLKPRTALSAVPGAGVVLRPP